MRLINASVNIDCLRPDCRLPSGPMDPVLKDAAPLNQALTLVLIFAASGVGALLRYGLGIALPHQAGQEIPSGTLVVNILGCAAIGIATELFRGPLSIPEEYRLMITVGLLGGFTTASAFVFQTLELAEAGRYGKAVLYVALTNGLCLAAGIAGHLATRAVFGLPGRG